LPDARPVISGPCDVRSDGPCTDLNQRIGPASFRYRTL